MIRLNIPVLLLLVIAVVFGADKKSAEETKTTQTNFISIEDTPYGECAKANAKLKPSFSRPPPGSFIPKCTTNGHYELVQCSSSTGKCWCSHADSGQKINATETRGDPDSVVCPACSKAKHQVLRAQPPFIVGAMIPDCQEDGNYKAKQCHGSTGYCWCVDPVTGEEINGTRIPYGAQNRPDCDNLMTLNNRTLSELLSAILPPLIPLNQFGNSIDSPTSKTPVVVKGTQQATKLCHLLKANTKSEQSNRPLIGAFVPKCTDEGRFERIQSHGSTGFSWCVDEIGREIPGTRVRGRPECDANSNQENVCSLQKSVGWNCGLKEMRWFYHEQKHTCFSFTYNGCGGNMNNFATVQQCQQRCYPSDGPTCSSEDSRWQNQTKPCARLSRSGEDPSDAIDCPAGYECRRGLISQCCNTTIERMFQESWEPQCLNGSVLTVSFGDYNQTVIAETCEDMLCPEGYACAMGPMFAHCCSNIQAPSENSALSDSSDSDPLSVEKVGKLCSVALKTSKVQGDSPPPGTFIPSCTEEGGFDPVQCHGSTGQCWCSDALGREIPQTRVRRSRQQMNCSGEFDLSPRSGCFEKKHVGMGCGQKQRRWYFNEAKQSCFAFIYTGCGGTLNNFLSLQECQQCRQSDGPVCVTSESFLANQTGVCRFSHVDSEAPLAVKNHTTSYECPTGFECKIGPFNTHCCNSTIEKLYRESYDPTCENGQKAYQVSLGSYNSTLLAESCEDLLCPVGYACTLSPLLAHCCLMSTKPDLSHLLSPPRGVNVGITHQEGKSENSGKPPIITFDVPTVFTQSSPTKDFKNCSEVNKILTPAEPGFTGWFAPRCTEEGNFVNEQCSPNGHCWCVDQLGRELPNTKVGPGQGPIKCDKSFGLLDHCTAPKHAGWGCHEQQLRWYFNSERRTCVSFKYNGCGGTTNNFLTLQECQKCLPRDGPTCSTAEAQLANQTQPCNKAGPDGKVQGCPIGYICKMGAFRSFCCNGTVESMALEAQSTNCPAGQAYQISTTSAFKQVLIADNCDELICPKGYACFSGAAFTHCCPEHPLSDEPRGSGNQQVFQGTSSSIDSGLQTSQQVTVVVGPKFLQCKEAVALLRSKIDDASLNKFIPKCNKDGSYSSQQCFNDSCWCVNGAGKEIPETRGNSTSGLNCDNVDPPRLECRARKDVGWGCGKNEERFYYNTKTQRCSRFVYSGCGGNMNNFDSLSKCWECMPSDLGPCSEEASYLQNATAPCSSPRTAPTSPCPSGYHCRMGAFFGSCCNTAIEELHTQSTSETCKHGKALKGPGFGGLPGSVVYADTCEDLLCPDDYECSQGPKAARCCPKDNSTLATDKAKPTVSVSFSQDRRDSRCNSAKPTYAPVQARSPESLWYFDSAHSSCQEFFSLQTEDRNILFPTKKECEDACLHGTDANRAKGNCTDGECTHSLNFTKSSHTEANIVKHDAIVNSTTPKCQDERTKATQFSESQGPGFVGNFIPQCKESGHYEQVQCHGSTGSCWCVDEESGEEVKGTRRGPGHGPPQCEGEDKKLCNDEDQKRFEVCQRPIRFNFPSPVLLKEPILVASLCASKLEYAKCVANIGCAPKGQNEAFDRLYAKLCDQGGFPLTKFATCLTSVLKMAAVQECSGIVNLSPSSNVSCEQLNNQLKCAKYHIVGLCGTEAYGLIQEGMEAFVRDWKPVCRLDPQPVDSKAEVVQECVMAQKEFLNCVSQPVPKPMSTPLSIIESTTTVQKACAMHTAFVVSSCRKPGLQCDGHFLNGVENVLQTLCNYIYNDYIQFRKCITDAVSVEGVKCFKEPPSLAMFNSTEDLKMCADVNSELRCLHAAITPDCNAAVGTSLDIVYQRFLDSWNPACPLLPTIPQTAVKLDGQNQLEPTVSERECNASETDRILSCSSRYAQHLVPITILMSGNDLDEICKSFHQAKVCVAKTDCRVSHLSGFAAMLELICSEGGQTGYLQHSNCWNQLAKKKEISACLAPHRGINPADLLQKDRICQSLSDTMSCIQPIVLQVCNRRAFEMIFAYHLAFAEGFSSCKLDLQMSISPGTAEPPTFLPIAASTQSANVSCMHILIESMLELSNGSPIFDSFCDGSITKFEICRIRQQPEGSKNPFEKSLGKFLNGFCFDKSDDNDTDCINPVYRDIEAAKCAHEFLIAYEDNNQTGLKTPTNGSSQCVIANRFFDCLLMPVAKRCANGEVPKILAELHADIVGAGCEIVANNDTQQNQTVLSRHSESENFCTEPVHKYLYPFTFVKGVASHTEICRKLPSVYGECRKRPGGLMAVNDGDAAVLQLTTQICSNPEMKKKFIGAVSCTFNAIENTVASTCLTEYTKQFGDSINLRMIVTEGDIHCRSILSLYSCIAPHLINTCGWNVFESLLSLEELFLEPLLPGCGLRLAERAKWYLSNISHATRERFLFYTLFSAQIGSVEAENFSLELSNDTVQTTQDLNVTALATDLKSLSTTVTPAFSPSLSPQVTGTPAITESTASTPVVITTDVHTLIKALVESDNRVAEDGSRNSSELLEQSQVVPNNERTNESQPSGNKGCLWQRSFGKSVDATDSNANSPQCQPNGMFQKLQCNTKSGYCWCANEVTGAEVNGTRNGPGQPLPRCDVNQVYACSKLAWKDGCEPDGRKPQLVLRWYNAGQGRCGVYMHSYCPSESLSPPVAIKYESLCERICLRHTGSE